MENPLYGLYSKYTIFETENPLQWCMECSLCFLNKVNYLHIVLTNRYHFFALHNMNSEVYLGSDCADNYVRMAV